MFSDLHLSVWAYGYLFYSMCYNPKLQLFIICRNHSHFDHWELLLVGSFAYSTCLHHILFEKDLLSGTMQCPSLILFSLPHSWDWPLLWRILVPFCLENNIYKSRSGLLGVLIPGRVSLLPNPSLNRGRNICMYTNSCIQTHQFFFLWLYSF